LADAALVQPKGEHPLEFGGHALARADALRARDPDRKHQQWIHPGCSIPGFGNGTSTTHSTPFLVS